MKFFSKTALSAVAVILVLSIAGCNLFLSEGNASDESDESEPIEIAGEWYESEHESGLTITDSTIEFTDDGSVWQTCKIVDFSNEQFNGGESGEGNCGYAVLHYTEPSSSIESDAQDKYGILRWQNLTDSGMEYAEGTKGTDTDGDGWWDSYTYFDTAREAKNSMTESDGFFSMYSAIDVAQ